MGENLRQPGCTLGMRERMDLIVKFRSYHTKEDAITFNVKNAMNTHPMTAKPKKEISDERAGERKISDEREGKRKISDEREGERKISHEREGERKISHEREGERKISHEREEERKISNEREGERKISNEREGERKIRDEREGEREERELHLDQPPRRRPAEHCALPTLWFVSLTHIILYRILVSEAARPLESSSTLDADMWKLIFFGSELFPDHRAQDRLTFFCTGRFFSKESFPFLLGC
ncbi:hypothetical protein FHG87_013518 [Trinorchestia longiramus]|nr:hypothetical protein FHG87_013518 [Trinorchestia longiramus]